MNLYVQCGSGSDVVNATSFEGQATLLGGTGNDTFQIGTQIAPGGDYQPGSGQSEMDIQASNGLPGPTNVTATPTEAASGQFTTATAGTYYFKILAKEGTATTISSSEVFATVNGTSANQVNLSWSAVPDATSYQVFIGKSAGNENLYQVATGTTYNFTSYGGAPGSVPPSATDQVNISGGYLYVDTAQEPVGDFDKVVVIGGAGNNIFSTDGSMKNVVLQGGSGTNTLSATVTQANGSAT